MTAEERIEVLESRITGLYHALALAGDAAGRPELAAESRRLGGLPGAGQRERHLTLVRDPSAEADFEAEAG